MFTTTSSATPATTTQWSSPSPHIYPHSHHGTPAQEYTGFNFGGPPQPLMESGVFAPSAQRPMHQQTQPLVIMPQWPSMLNSHQPGYQSMYPAPMHSMPVMPIPAVTTPVSAGSNRSISTPRKTLTDHDRKRMCQYAEEHPNSKQTEIGGMCLMSPRSIIIANTLTAIFGVERR